MERFRVIFDGRFLQDERPETVQRRLVEMFHADDPRLPTLFQMHQQGVVKQGLTKITAEQFAAALRAAGAACHVEAEPDRELRDQDLERIAAERAKSEYNVWREARWWALVKRCHRYAWIAVITCAGAVALVQIYYSWLDPKGRPASPVADILQYVERKLDSHPARPSSSASPLPDLAASPAVRAHAIRFTFRDALPLRIGVQLTVDRWAFQADGGLEAYRVLASGTPVETVQVQTTPRTHPISGIVRSVRGDGRSTIFDLAVDRATYEFARARRRNP